MSPPESPIHVAMLAKATKGVVLLADDEDLLRDSTQDILEDAGYRVLSARNGSEALRHARTMSEPAVAIVDLVMPGVDGWDVIGRIRSSAELQWLPIIVLSSYAREPIVGATRLMKKPFRPTELLAAVRELCIRERPPGDDKVPH